MTVEQLLNLLGVLLMVGAVLLIIAIRVAGVDLTEGQAFIKYLPYWILVTVMLCCGVFIGIINKP